jgi:protein SCO1/2
MKRRTATSLALLAWPCLALAHDSKRDERLPVIGPAPGFTLTSQDGQSVSLGDLRGKAVAVTFIYASCPDTCPLLTDKMARVQDALGADFGSKIAFVSITVDPGAIRTSAETIRRDLRPIRVGGIS